MSVSRTGVATVMPFFAVSTFVVMSVSRPVLAEDAGTEPLSLMPVIVKARHSDEALEDVPFTVNVIEAAQIERLSLPTLEAALAQTPGVDALSFGDNWSGFVRIRGVGSLGKAGLDDNSVVIYSDGMPQSMMSTSLDLLDVERVEVLKGPQGTLFGRGSEGGAITVRSRRPTRHAEGYLGAEVGTDAQRQATGAFGGPLGDTLSGRVAFRYRAADGVVTNQRDGEVLTKPEDYVVRGSLLWQPRQETALTLIAGHEAYHEGPSTVTIYPFNDKPVVDVPPGTQYSDKDTTRITAELTHAFGVANFTAVTGYSDTDVFRRNPKFDPLVMERLYGVKLDSDSPTDVREKLFNQELRLASLPSDPVFWVVGTNIYRSERELDSYDGVDNFNVASAFNADIYSDFDVDSYSVFGELTYPLRDNLKLTGGVRHTWDDKSYDALWIAADNHPLAGTMNTDKQTLSDNYATGRVALSYALSDRTTVYSVYARGYKSGGWFDYVGTNVSRGLAEPTYKAAKTDSVELGFKFADAQGRLRVSGAAFFSETADDHLVGFDAVNFVATTENFDTQSVGAELQITWSPMREFLLSGGLAYTDATITRIPDASSTDAQDGDAVPASPLWSTTLSMTHEQTLPSFWGITNPALLSTVTHRYVGERTADVGEHFDLPAYHKLDARIGISTHSTDVYLWGDNLLDEIYDVGSGFYVPAIPADFGGTGQDAKMSTPARGRALGIGVKHHF